MLSGFAFFTRPNGQGGYPFDFGINKRGVEEIKIRHNKYVDGIELKYRDGKKSGWTGGQGGTESIFCIAPNDCIVKVKVWCGWGTDAVQFITKNGEMSPKYGGPGGKETIQTVSAPGMELVGISGRSCYLLDKIHFTWGESESIHRIEYRLLPLVECEGGSAGRFEQEETIESGCWSSHEMSTNVVKVSAIAKLRLAADLVFLSFDSDYQANFERALDEHYQVKKKRTKISVDYSKPCYWYQARVYIRTSCGDDFRFSSEHLMQSPTRLVRTSFSSSASS